MNKKLMLFLIPILLLIIGIIVIVIIMNIKNKDSSKQLELTYDINAGIPFKWDFEIEDPNIVEFKKSYVIRDDNKGGLVGGKVVTNYVFVGKKEGVTTVTFNFVRIDREENNIESSETHTIKVDKDLNISLVAIDEK